MKSHSSKAPRKSFDVTKMSGPDIAAEMARHMAEFKSGRKPSGPAAGRKESASSAPQSRQSQPANHPFLRASLAAEDSSSLAFPKSRDGGFDADARSSPGSDGGKGLAFLRHRPRHDRWPEIVERSPVQYSRRRSSYRAGLLAGVGLTLMVIAAASAALWKTGALPDFIEARLPAAPVPAGPADSERAASTIASTDASTIRAPSADLAQPAPTPIVLMVAPAPPPITNPTLAVDTLSAITAVQPDAPAVEFDEAGSFPSVISDPRAAAPAVVPPPMAAPAAEPPADPLVTSPTLRALKQLAERPSLKPDLDIAQFTGPEAVTAVSGDETTVDQPQATPYVAAAKPFIPAASPLPATGRGTAAARDPEASTSESSTRQALSPLPPPIVIRSAGGVVGAVSVEVSEQPADGDQRGGSSYDQASSRSQRDAGSETDAGRNGGLGVAGAQSDGTSASARGGDHSGNPGGGDSGGGTSGGGTDPGGDGGSGGSGGGSSGDGDGGSGGDGSGGDGSGGGGSDGGDGSGGDGSGGDGSGGDGSGGDGSGGDGGDGGSGSGGSDGGSGGGGDSGGDGGGGSGSDGGGGDGGGGSDGGSGSDGGGDSGGGTDGGGDSDGGDSDGGDSDGSGDGGDGTGGDDGSASGGGLGGALGGAIGGLGGALGGALGGLGN